MDPSTWNAKCVALYLLEKGGLHNIYELRHQQLQPQTPSRCNIPPMQCILGALSFLSSGNLQHAMAMIHGVSQLSTSHCLFCFLDAMLQHLDCYLDFPTHEGKLCRVHEQFCAIAGLPNVIGCADRTYVPLLHADCTHYTEIDKATIALICR